MRGRPKAALLFFSCRCLFSLRSRPRTNYRRVAAGSQVDDSLFGRPNGIKATNPAKTSTLRENASLRTQSAGAPVVMTVSEGQLRRMLEPSPILSADQVATIKRDRAVKREADRAVANQRKEMMLRLEEQRKAAGAKTETEMIKKVGRRGGEGDGRQLPPGGGLGGRGPGMTSVGRGSPAGGGQRYPGPRCIPAGRAAG